jgi:hypothetical protein
MPAGSRGLPRDQSCGRAVPPGGYQTMDQEFAGAGAGGTTAQPRRA